MPNKDFLENIPLYTKYSAEDIHFTKRIGPYHAEQNIFKPPLNFECQRCNSLQTFKMVNDYEGDQKNPWGSTFYIVYACAACGRMMREFFVHFFREETAYKNDDGEEETEVKYFMKKVGQYPAWEIVPDKELSKMLGQHVDLYKKGLTNESQGYGIGAYAYFRRIAEDLITDLIESMQELIPEGEKREEYAKAIEKVKKTKVTEQKIELVQELLPPTLVIENYNPLKALHGALSVGLHGMSDEECVKQAAIIRKVLVFMVNEIKRSKESKKEFTEGLIELLGGKSHKK